MRPRHRMTRSVVLTALLWLVASPGFAATMQAVRMKVVDAQDESAVAGAFVLFQASAQEGTWTGHGGRHVNLFAAETVTDASGEIRLPKQEFPAQPFFLNTNYNNPSMIVFKPGYALVSLLNQRLVVPELRDMTSWEHNDRTIKMKRATTDSEIAHAVDQAALYAKMTMSSRSLCAWKSVPRFFVAVDRAAAEWNRRRESLTDDNLRFRSVSSPLQFVLMNETLFVEKGCGSPKAFFEPYLRRGAP
jgi:hypothetical protein